MKVAIAGSGLVGRVLALNLLELGHEVTFFEKESKEGVKAAGFTAAGMLAPFAELETAESMIFEYGKRSMQLWEGLLKQIGLYDGLRLEGSLITAHPQDMSELDHFISTLAFKVADAKESIELLDSSAIASLEPELAHHPKGFFLRKEGQVDAQRFFAFSTTYLEHHPGVRWQEFTQVIRLEPFKVHLENETLHFDWVFDARGLGAKEHFEDLRGVRGEVVWVESSEVEITRPTRLMHPRYKIYIVPRQNGCEGMDLEYYQECKISTQTGGKRYIIGATEIESEDCSPISVRSSLELLSALYSVHPSFGEARVVHTMTNLRPALKDNLPRIEHQEGLTRVNGLYRHGYLLAPAIVEKALTDGIGAEKSA